MSVWWLLMGAGSSPAGGAPAGVDVVLEPSAPPVARGPGAVWYDGSSKQFLLDATGAYRTLHPVDQKVALRLIIREGDIASLPTFGCRLRKIGRGSPAKLKTAAEDAVRLALADLLTAGDIALVAVDIEQPGRGKLLAIVRYRNLALRDGQERTVRLNA